MNLTLEQIETVRNWWINAISRQTSDQLIKTTGIHVGNLKNIFDNSDRYDDVTLLIFNLALSRRLVNSKFVDGKITLRVDYHAEGILKEAADEANISDMDFPWKTTMHINYDGSVIVHTEGADPEILLGPIYED